MPDRPHAPGGAPHKRLPAALTRPRLLPLASFWRRRMVLSMFDSYAGLPLVKLPEDLRAYEHLLWLDAPDVVVEIGTLGGGSAVWFRDRLELLRLHGRIAGPGLVISVDNDLSVARDEIGRAGVDVRGIELVEHDVLTPGLREAIEAHVPEGARVLVVEDGAHRGDTTAAALDALAGIVPPGGYLVVEDGCVDVPWMRVQRSWPRGVLPAVEAFLAGEAGRAFRRRPDLEIYGLTTNVGGYLQRVP